ncbi:MAG TPA: hypothetical protein VFS24_07430 [Steroidobacteraceae bacterium]|nr:hypothetical protein [Steroidobacteraceae bacterium]
MLTEAAVRNLRRKYAEAPPRGKASVLRYYARIYDVAESAIAQAAKGVTYRWVA